MTEHNGAITDHDVIAYLDGELSPGKAEDVRRAIDESPELRKTYETYKAMYAALESNAPGSGPLDDNFAASVVQAAESAEGDGGFTDYDAFYADSYRAISGEFSAPDAALFEARLSDSPVHREAFSHIESAVRDLEKLGEWRRTHTPTIDIAGGVMRAIDPEAETPENIVPFTKRAAVRWAAGIAVAAAAVLFIAVQADGPATPDPVENVPIAMPTDPAPADPPEVTPDDVRNALQEAIANARNAQPRMPVSVAEVPDETEAADPEGPTLEDMIALRRVAFDPNETIEAQDEAFRKLMKFAALGEETARLITQNPDASPRLKAAVAEFLPADEEADVLELAVHALPEDPYVQFRAAQSALELQRQNPTQEHTAAAVTAAMNFTNANPNNATGYMLEAAARVNAGDFAGAQIALQDAAGAETATTFARESANLRAEALTQSAGNSEAAALAAALTGGLNEYSFVIDIGETLLEAGVVSLENGDTQSANTFVESVYGYGDRVGSDAIFSFSQLAGLDLEQSALAIFDEFRDFLLPTSGSLLQWTAQAEQVAQDVRSISTVFTELDAVLAELASDQIPPVTRAILFGGDISILSEEDR